MSADLHRLTNAPLVDLAVGAIVAAAGPRANYAHAAVVSSVFPDDATGDAVTAYTLRPLCPRGFGASRIGKLAFVPAAPYHGWRQTCAKCARAVLSEPGA